MDSDLDRGDEMGEDEAGRRTIDILEEKGLKYVLQLGRGRFGMVFLMELGNQERYAVKIVQDAEIQQGENYHWRSLEHENIVALTGEMRIPEAGAKAFIMEKFDAPIETHLNQYKYLREKDDLRTAIGWLKDIAEGVKYLHSKDFCHLDLKCENVLLRNNTAAITDFGFLTRADEPVNRYGSPIIYRPPEACLVDGTWTSVDGKHYDTWTLGLVALEMMTGMSIQREAAYLPEDADDWQLCVYPILRKILQKKRFTSLVKKAFPGTPIKKKTVKLILNLIKACLNINPQERPTAKAIVQHKIFTHPKMNKPKDNIWSSKMKPAQLDALLRKHITEPEVRVEVENNAANQPNTDLDQADGKSTDTTTENPNVAIADASDVGGINDTLNPEIEFTKSQKVVNWIQKKKEDLLRLFRRPTGA